MKARRVIERQLKNPRGKLVLAATLFLLGFGVAARINGGVVTVLSPKDFIGCITVALSVASLGGFILDALWGESRPHLYSWFIWTIVNGVAWFNQWTHQAGPGAWSTLVMTALSGTIFFIALSQYIGAKGSQRLTTLDQWCLVGALGSIVLLVIYNTGPVSIIAATVTDIFAFGPTLKKVWRRPRSEPLTNYSLNTVRHTIALLAMGSYNFVAVLFPISLILFNGVTVAVIITRRRQLGAGSEREPVEQLLYD